MFKITAQLFMSIDGVVEAPEQWHFDFWNDQMEDAVSTLLYRSDAMLLGRKTYEIFAASWPQRGSDALFADRINDMPKLVASRTLKDARWNHSSLIQGDAADGLRRMNAEADRRLVLTGSPGLVRSLLSAGVLDELNLLVHPVVLGSGDRLFREGFPKMRLRLLETVAFSSGVLNLTYSAASEPEVPAPEPDASSRSAEPVTPTIATAEIGG